MRPRIVIIVAALLAGCSNLPDTFGVNVSVSAAMLDGAERARIATLTFTVRGDEQFDETVSGTSLRDGDFHVHYVPGIASGTLRFHVAAIAADSSTVASGDSDPITLLPGHAVAATIRLGPAVADLGAVADIGGVADLEGVADLGAVDSACIPTVTSCPATVGCGTISDGCSGTVDCGQCLLAALEPSLANTGASLTLEGSFAAGAMVNFPGGVAQPATLVGAHRATVIVPAGATAGGLTVTTGGSTVGPLPFRDASFALGIGPFNANYEQAELARQMPALVTPRSGATSALAGNSLYVIGGANQGGALTSIERATLDGDGSLSSFTTLPVTLTVARELATCVVVGSSIYVIGGDNAGGAVGNVERATVNADGSLSSFTALATVQLALPRYAHASVVIGNSLYVVGGRSNGSVLGSVERATINPDGSLSTFATVPGSTLTTARQQHGSIVVGSSLYVVGGSSASAPLGSVERATIANDGSLSGFTEVPGLTLTTPRQGHSTVVVGDALYLVGGSDGGGPIGSVERALINADGSLSSFTTVAGVALTTARAAHSSVVAGNSLYIVGGDDGVAMSSVERATLDAGGALSAFGTVSGVTLATPRSQHATVVAGDSLYLIGGFDGGTLDSVERATIGADGSLSSFVIVPGLVLAQARFGHSAAVIGDTLYVIGGSYGFPVLGSVEQATIAVDGSLSAFVTVPGVVLVTPRTGHTSVVVGSALYVLGGDDATGTSIDSVERATIAADGSLSTFATIAGGALATARDGHSSAVVGDSLFVTGGLDTDGNLVSALERATINADDSLSTFATVAGVALATPRYLQSSVVVGGSLYILGGSQGAGEILDSVEQADISAADGSLSGFTLVPGSTLVTSRQAHSNVVLGNMLYVLGGWNGANVGSVERALLQ